MAGRFDKSTRKFNPFGTLRQNIVDKVVEFEHQQQKAGKKGGKQGGRKKDDLGYFGGLSSERAKHGKFDKDGLSKYLMYHDKIGTKNLHDKYSIEQAM